MAPRHRRIGMFQIMSLCSLWLHCSVCSASTKFRELKEPFVVCFSFFFSCGFFLKAARQEGGAAKGCKPELKPRLAPGGSQAAEQPSSATRNAFNQNAADRPLNQWFSTGGSRPKSRSQTRFQWVVGLCLGKEMLKKNKKLSVIDTPQQ